MKVILVKPNEPATMAEIGSDLQSLQDTVGGFIEALYPFDDEVAIICNEEGKLTGQPLNRALHDADGNLYDIIAGSFIICWLTDDNFDSLNEEQLKTYLDKFRKPEVFVRVNDRIIAVKI